MDRETAEFLTLIAQIPATALGMWLGWKLSEYLDKRGR